MPIHDWTRVTAGTFHAFHLAWIAEVQRVMNSGFLPPEYYALAEHVTENGEGELVAARRRTLVIRHLTGDRVVALIEIVSPGNKQSRATLDAFVDKAVAALEQGFHLLVVDILPPGSFDPQGMHGAVWGRIEGPGYHAPQDKPLTLAAYTSGAVVTAYVEPVAIGAALPEMPLFLDPGHYVYVPLEKTYESAWQAMPQRWRSVIEGHVG
jgi:hypothetical protein